MEKRTKSEIEHENAHQNERKWYTRKEEHRREPTRKNRHSKRPIRKRDTLKRVKDIWKNVRSRKLSTKMRTKPNENGTHAKRSIEENLPEKIGTQKDLLGREIP